MATPIVMPRQGNTVETCTIVEWRKLKGDKVAEGDLLFTYETDKASFEFTAPAAGTLLDVFFDTNVDIPVLTTVAVVGEPGENYESLKPTAGGAPASQEAAEKATVAPSAAKQSDRKAAPAPSSGAGVSPRARAAASESGVDPAQVAGSGPKGRVIERDVREAASAGPRLTPAAAAKAGAAGLAVPSAGTGIGGRVRLADLATAAAAGAVGPAGSAGEYTEVKLSKIRSIIAERMMSSLEQAAQLTMNSWADATTILAYRKRVKAQAKEFGLSDINITDMVAYALVRVLQKHPELNATVEGDMVHQYRRVHLALAVDTTRGLMVPVVRCADALSLSDLAAALKSVAGQCQDGSVNPDLLSGGTLTLSNIGTYGIESFTPIINRPQVAILGLNTISPKPVAAENGEYRMVPHIGLSLTIDHRAVDGAPAARFLKELVQAISSFDLTLAA